MAGIDETMRALIDDWAHCRGNHRCIVDVFQEIAFKTEAVSIGRVHCVRLYVMSNEMGEQLYEGLSVLQAIYDRRGLVGINVAADWLVDRVVIRESPHVPYRFVLKHSRVKEVEEDGEIFKEIVLSEMEGLPTKINKKKARKREKPQYVLSMTLGERSTLAPNVSLCSANAAVQMAIIDTAPVDGIISFQEKSADIGLITKVRIAVDGSQRLNRILAEEGIHSEENVLEIRKMRLTDTMNGDELRFANVNAVLAPSLVREFAAVWPDVPPLALIRYQLTVTTDESSGKFDVFVNIKGSCGDTGLRKLLSEEASPFQPNTVIQL
ncbi:unnamed protein product [Toxocara canis]|uniref:Rad60-SLD domain-containing protein n=1 Tax=Toxocara canis TaxID=6265 RepID=A0A183UT02_TOXCA|nr:unnamed protein product [Toxocara canis]